MAQPSKAGAVFLFVFGLPFFGFGLFAAFAFLSSSPAIHKSGDPIAGAVFASVFALIGAGLMVGAVYGYQRLKQDEATKEANPNSPWLWRPDWPTSKAFSLTRNSAIGWWIGTVLASMIAVPIVTTALPPLLRNSDPKALILLGLCLAPLILLVGALRATIRRERYGNTYFEFGSLPFCPGKRISGQIQLRLPTSTAHGVDLRLSCIRRIVTGSGKEQSTNEIVLWQNQKNVPQTALSVGPLGSAIPVDFGIPQDAYETNHDVDRDQLLWVLTAKADVPGVDYSDKFEVPVFRTGSSGLDNTGAGSSSQLNSSFGFGAAAAGTAPAFESDSSDVVAPVNPKVVVSTTSDGATEFYSPHFVIAARHLDCFCLRRSGQALCIFWRTRERRGFLPWYSVFLIYFWFTAVFRMHLESRGL